MYVRRWRRTARSIVSSFLLLALPALLGCAGAGGQSYVQVRPRTEVVRTTTSFSSALRCMDDLYLTHGVRDLPITTIGIPDATGQVRTGVRDMLITAISQMSERSRAFRYVDWEYESKELQVLFQQVRDADKARLRRLLREPPLLHSRCRDAVRSER